MSEAAAVEATPTPGPAIFDTGDAADEGAAAATGAAAQSANGYEAPWLEKAAGGKYRKVEDFVKGYDEFGGLIQARTQEVKDLGVKAADLEKRWKAVEPIVGAPMAEDGKTPAPYDWGFPPEAEVDKVLVGLAENTLRELNLSNAAAQKIGERLVGYEAAREIGWREREAAAGVAALGAKDLAEARQIAAEDFAWWTGSPLLKDIPDLADVMADAGNSGKVTGLLHHLRAALTKTSMGRAMGGGATFGAAEYEALLVKQSRGNVTAEEQDQITAYVNAKTAAQA